MSNEADPPGSASDPPRPPLQPPTQQSSFNPFMSTFNYLAEPVTYPFLASCVALSEDEAPTPLARALSANYNGVMTDPTLGVYHPPKRRISPFQPPPLTPLALNGYKDGTTGKARLLSKALAEEIRLLIPPRLQLMDHWTLTYSLEQNGSTLSTLYGQCDVHRGKRGGFVLVVRDTEGGIFGGYLTDPPRPQAHYYGTGECFLWRASRLPALPDLSSLPPPPSADTTHLQRMTTIANSNQQLIRIACFPRRHEWRRERAQSRKHSKLGADTVQGVSIHGENDFSIFCQPEYLSVGGGDGHYGLWLNDTLSQGVSAPCLTFGNEALSDEGRKFDIFGVEVWYVGA